MFPILPALVEILLPLSLIDGLIAASLITVQEFEKLSLPMYDNVERSRMLLLSILPRKGPDSFDRFLNVLSQTEGQEHVAQRIMKTTEEESERDERVERRVESEKIKELERELKKEKVTNVCLRTKVGRV